MEEGSFRFFLDVCYSSQFGQKFLVSYGLINKSHTLKVVVNQNNSYGMLLWAYENSENVLRGRVYFSLVLKWEKKNRTDSVLVN